MQRVKLKHIIKMKKEPVIIINIGSLVGKIEIHSDKDMQTLEKQLSECLAKVINSATSELVFTTKRKISQEEIDKIFRNSCASSEEINISNLY